MPETETVNITEAQLKARIKHLEEALELYQKLIVQIKWNLREISEMLEGPSRG